MHVYERLFQWASSVTAAFTNFLVDIKPRNQLFSGSRLVWTREEPWLLLQHHDSQGQSFYTIFVAADYVPIDNAEQDFEALRFVKLCILSLYHPNMRWATESVAFFNFRQQTTDDVHLWYILDDDANWFFD